MNEKLWSQLNAVLGSLVVIIGLWLLIGAFPMAWGVLATLALAFLLS
mgnify:FL=1